MARVNLGKDSDRDSSPISTAVWPQSLMGKRISSRSHAERRNAVRDALRPFVGATPVRRRGASKTAFRRGASERGTAVRWWSSARSLEISIKEGFRIHGATGCHHPVRFDLDEQGHGLKTTRSALQPVGTGDTSQFNPPP